MATIWSLNYHEVLDDARVLKQARVLAGAGHNLTVFSHFPEGRPKFQDLDGFKIHRFAWSDFSSLRETDKQIFEFLEPSFSAWLDNFNALVDQAELLRPLESEMVKFADLADLLDGPVTIYDKVYYQDHTGLKRIRRKIRHNRAVRKLKNSNSDDDKSRYLLASEGLISKSALKEKRKQIRHIKKYCRELFRGLYQSKSLVFAANLLREDLAGKPDVIHAHDIYTLPAGVLLAQRYNCKLIYDAHELEIERATISGDDTKAMVDRLERTCLGHVDALITVSEAIGEAYSKRYKRRRPTIVMNAPELELKGNHDKRIKDIRTMSKLPKDVPLIVFTGGIQREHRGVDKVLQALNFLPGVHLAILGPRHEQNDAWLTEFARNLDVLDRIHIHPPVDARDVVATISTASVSVIPFQAGPLNHEFAMPNKLFEAAFARVPLAVSNLTEMRRFVEALGIGRSMDQSDPENIAEAIDEVLRDPQKFHGIADIEAILQDRYSWDAQAKKLTQLYNEILQTGASASQAG